MRRLLYILLLFLTLPVVAQEEKLRQHGFSVSDDRKVFFAPGNLQYNAAMGTHLCADGTMQQGTWRFAENQWDYIGSHTYASSTYNGWIDLYAWGTSGWSNGVEEYQPWSSTTGFPNCYYINGDASLSMTGDYENADWAVYNSIGEYSPNSWRTLSAEEWEFILNGRTNASILCGKATINNVCGLIFLPDDYPFADLSLPQFIPGNDRFCSTNKYTESQWEQLENKGAVFLPAAGVNYGGNNNFPNRHGYYWSVSACNENKQSRAYNLEFYSDVNYPSTQITPNDRRGGQSVRPVMDIPKNYVPTVKMDTTVCDTLMPFTWHGLLFNKPGSQTILLKDEQGCDSIEIDYTLSTFHCEDFCLEGELLFREDFGGNDAGDSEISCAHVSGIANFYTNACQEVRKHPEYGMSTMNYVLTKKGQGNRQWHVQDDHTYPNDYTRGYFLEVDGYGGTIYKTTVNNLYEGMELTFSSYIANLHDSCVIANMRKNYGYTYPRFKFILKDAESNAELATYTTGNILPDITTPCVLAKSALWQLKGMKYVVPEGVSSIQMLINNDVASYDGNDFGIDDIEIRLCYMPAKKIVQDTIICDTIDNIVWRNKIYPLKNELRDTVYDSSGADSIYYILNVIMEHCCPEIKEKTITIGTLCDTLLPYTLYFRDTVLTFKMAGDLLLEFQHPQWDCIDSIYTLHLDTIHCERLYDIIVNKYNWQLLCHNVSVRELFPELTVTGYQWYKDGTAIPNATEDDYSEQNELHGVFQLRITLDDSRVIWSNIISILDTQDQQPLHLQVYNSQGVLIPEKRVTHGMYLFRYEQGEKVWTEKRMVP